LHHEVLIQELRSDLVPVDVALELLSLEQQVTWWKLDELRLRIHVLALLALCILHDTPKRRTVEGKVHLVDALPLLELQLGELFQVNFAFLVIDLSDPLLEYVQLDLIFFHGLSLYESLEEVVDTEDSEEVGLVRV
jgi:hypothetical protein